MSINFKEITYVDQGLFDMGVLIDNFKTLFDAVNDAVKTQDIDAEYYDSIYPAQIGYVVDELGEYVVLNSAYRADMKIHQVYITAGADGVDTEIDVMINGETILQNPITMKSTEGRGKIVIGNALEHITITRFDEIVISTSSNRRVLMNISFKGTDD